MNVIKNIVGALCLIIACIAGFVALCFALVGYMYFLYSLPELILDIAAIVCGVLFCIGCFVAAYTTVDNWRNNRH